MQVPEEFKRLTRCFLQGSDREAANEEEWIARALALNTLEQQAVIRKFLAELLVEQTNSEDLQRAWNSGGSSYGLHAKGIRRFLEKIRDMIHA